MNIQSIRILYLKDLFLSRRTLFSYFVAGIVASCVSCIPNETLAFIGSILIITVAIAAGLHLIGSLLLAEVTEQTRLFVMSLPVSLLDYSIAKIAVVLTTYLIPWTVMLACSIIFVVAGTKAGSVAVIPVIFLFLLAAFTVQLVTAVVTESFSWTICVVVACNVLLNVVLKNLMNHPAIVAAAESKQLAWPPIVWQWILIELAIIIGAIVVSVLIQTRKRDLI